MKVLCCSGVQHHYASTQVPKQAISMTQAKKKLPIMHNAETFEAEFKKEARFLKTFNHPHVVKMLFAKVEDE